MANWLITGAASGLGLALAKAALAHGDTVCGTVRKQEAVAAFEALAPGRAFAVVLDLSELSAIGAAAEQAIAALGQVDILVNNAGYGLIGAIEEAGIAEAKAQFDVNVFAPIALIQAVLPAMRARGEGRIINVTSVSGLASWAGTGVYCASKYALEAIGQTLRQEVGPLGIKVTNIEPGGMRTDYAGGSMKIAVRKIEDYEPTAGQSLAILQGHAGQEAGDPDKVADAIIAVANLAEPPMHLLLGEDALHYAMRQQDAFGADMQAWMPLTLSTGF